MAKREPDRRRQGRQPHPLLRPGRSTRWRCSNRPSPACTSSRCRPTGAPPMCRSMATASTAATAIPTTRCWSSISPPARSRASSISAPMWPRTAWWRRATAGCGSTCDIPNKLLCVDPASGRVEAAYDNPAKGGHLVRKAARRQQALRLRQGRCARRLRSRAPRLHGDRSGRRARHRERQRQRQRGPGPVARRPHPAGHRQ